MNNDFDWKVFFKSLVAIGVLALLYLITCIPFILPIIGTIVLIGLGLYFIFCTIRMLGNPNYDLKDRLIKFSLRLIFTSAYIIALIIICIEIMQ